MMWYAFMFNQDHKNKFDSKLNMTEYLASFINYEAVQKTRESRDNKKVMSDEDFERVVRENFGRDLNINTLETTKSLQQPKDNIKKETKKKGSISIDDIKKYTGIELDEIKYIPDKK